MKRVVELSMPLSPFPEAGNPFESSLPGAARYVEPFSETRVRGDIFAYLHAERYQFGCAEGDAGSQITCTTDPFPGTHTETYYPEKWWYPEGVERKVYSRDLAGIPVSKLAGEAVILDLPYKDHIAIDIPDLEKFEDRIGRGAFVFIKTGFSNLYRGSGPDQRTYEASPGLTNAAAEWLVNRGIAVFGIDGRGLEAERFQRPDADLMVHRIFHLANVTLIEDLANLDKLTADRVYVICGTPVRAKYLSGGPARVVALDPAGPIELSHCLRQFPERKVVAPPRVEPVQKKAYHYKWLRLQPFSMREFEVDDVVGPEYIHLNSHTGTHLEVGTGADTGSMAPSRLWGPATFARLEHIGPRQLIRRTDLEAAAGNVRNGDALVVYTGYTDRYYWTDDFIDASPGLTEDAAEWLIARGVTRFVSDLACLDPHATLRGEDSTRAVADALRDAGIDVVNCATNLWMLQKDHFELATLPIGLQGVHTATSHVLAIEEWQ